MPLELLPKPLPDMPLELLPKPLPDMPLELPLVRLPDVPLVPPTDPVSIRVLKSRESEPTKPPDLLMGIEPVPNSRLAVEPSELEPELLPLEEPLLPNAVLPPPDSEEPPTVRVPNVPLVVLVPEDWLHASPGSTAADTIAPTSNIMRIRMAGPFASFSVTPRRNRYRDLADNPTVLPEHPDDRRLGRGPETPRHK
jgi:hypothetical protein